MLSRIIIYVFAATFIFSITVAESDTIYTWTDENGVLHMTNIPPVQPKGKVNFITIKPRSVTEEPEIQYTQPQEESEPVNETEIYIIDNHVIVPAVISYKNKKVSARLLLDTGSTNITLHKDIADKLSIDERRKGSIRVAGGDLIEAEAVLLDSVAVGPQVEKGLVAGIIEHTGPDVAFDGLLGMNFLKNYQYSIDFENQVLIWNR